MDQHILFDSLIQKLDSDALKIKEFVQISIEIEAKEDRSQVRTLQPAVISKPAIRQTSPAVAKLPNSRGK